MIIVLQIFFMLLAIICLLGMVAEFKDNRALSNQLGAVLLAAVLALVATLFT